MAEPGLGEPSWSVCAALEQEARFPFPLYRDFPTAKGDVAERKGRMDDGLAYLQIINGAVKASPAWQATAEIADFR